MNHGQTTEIVAASMSRPIADPETPHPSSQLDALLPPQMARRAVELGVKKAQTDVLTILALAVLAGAFIAFGAVAATVAGAGTSSLLPFGVTRILVGFVFSVGLMLVVVGGAELFTGNNLIVMAWASSRVSSRSLLKNWAVVYLGNLVGAVGIAVLIALSGHFDMGNGAVGQAAVNAATVKLEHSFVEAFSLGILANVLVCLAVWLSYSARSTTDRVLAVIGPVATFVAAGFEHCIANMYYVPVVLIHGEFGLLEEVGVNAQAVSGLTWSRFFISNLLPVTLGNIAGGAGLVGIVYWFVYLRQERQDGRAGS